MDYRLDVWSVTKCGHTQQLWGKRNKSGEFLFPSTDFMKGIKELLT